MCFLFNKCVILTYSVDHFRYCPLNDLPKYDLLDEKIYVENRYAV